MISKISSDTNISRFETDLGQGTSFVTRSNIGSPLMAGFLERFVAFLIDGFLVNLFIFVLTFIINVIALYVVSIITGVDVFLDEKNSVYFYDAMGIILLYLIFYCSYYIYFYRKQGQTPGKMVIGLKVVNVEDLKSISVKNVILREVIGKFLSGVFFLLGYYWYFLNKERKTWHDMLGHSIVVKTDEEGDILTTGPEKYEISVITAIAFFVITIMFFIAMYMVHLLVVDILSDQEFINRFNFHLQNQQPIIK